MWSNSQANAKLTAEVQWTFPLDFVEVVWGDGKKVDSQIVKATDTSAHGRWSSWTRS